MPKLLPDQSFYPSPTLAMQAPLETLADVAMLNTDPAASVALGDGEGNGPGGIFLLDHEIVEIKGRWERGPQYLSFDLWWHFHHDTMITSKWGTPNMVEAGAFASGHLCIT